MSGERDLQILLRSMAPTLRMERFVFVSIANAEYGDYAELKPLAAFREQEGLTLVLEHAIANQIGLSEQAVFRCITLSVHSSLNAVGLTAAVAAALSAHGISANVIAAYFHDHVFVREQHADKAIEVLTALSRSSA